jgi:hypothetical protein
VVGGGRRGIGGVGGIRIIVDICIYIYTYTHKSEIRTFQRIVVYTSRVSTFQPSSRNPHIYHFHASESPNLIFCFGGGG